MQIETKCSKCNQTHSIDYYGNINVAESPELKTGVLDGSLFTWECPHCGQSNLVRYPLVYHDPVSYLMLWMSPDEQDIERIKPIIDSSSELASYELRIVDGPGELIEKVKLNDAGLDDLAMEICKYVTCNELGKDVQLRFLRFEGSDNEMILTYPNGSEMELLAVGFNVYEDCAAIIGRNPSLRDATRGLVKVDRDLVSDLFR